jgi:hypothetical protein
MTKTMEHAEVVAEALAAIDRGLTDVVKRQLLSSSEVADLLLDVRAILATAGKDD